MGATMAATPLAGARVTLEIKIKGQSVRLSLFGECKRSITGSAMVHDVGAFDESGQDVWHSLNDAQKQAALDTLSSAFLLGILPGSDA